MKVAVVTEPILREAHNLNNPQPYLSWVEPGVYTVVRLFDNGRWIIITNPLQRKKDRQITIVNDYEVKITEADYDL